MIEGSITSDFKSQVLCLGIDFSANDKSKAACPSLIKVVSNQGGWRSTHQKSSNLNGSAMTELPKIYDSELCHAGTIITEKGWLRYIL